MNNDLTFLERQKYYPHKITIGGKYYVSVPVYGLEECSNRIAQIDLFEKRLKEYAATANEFNIWKPSK